MEAWIFVLGSVLIIYISRKSLTSPQSHGFYRFLAWECILGLFLLNVRFWFVQPLAWNQLASWVLLFGSFIPLGFGVHFLRTQGRQADKREGDPSLYDFEKTTNLVTSGIYKYIRHPLYCSLLLLTWGIFFKHITLTVATLAIAATVFLVFTAKADEAECIRFFGSQYQDYMKRSKMFIPYVF
ncbi:protein-S-isoprenylcysteine O-methyltransferase [Anaerolineales bacterium]|nr:protein-S-isoprenylcysteine O-methyltransferase [Anaerolineales bacterium]